MIQTDFTQYKFRCSSLGVLMTEPRNKKDKLSKTTMSELKELHSEALFGYRREFSNIYTKKGNMNEDDSIRLLSNIHNRPFDSLYTKNEKSFENEFIKGTPDIHIENEFLGDVKTSYSDETFPMYEDFSDLKTYNKNYYWQMQGYMWLTGLNKSILAYCLVDSDLEVVEYDKFKKARELNVIDLPEQIEQEIHLNHSPSQRIPYDSIRVSQFPVALNENDIEKLKERISDCREYMNQLSEFLNNKIQLK